MGEPLSHGPGRSDAADGPVDDRPEVTGIHLREPRQGDQPRSASSAGSRPYRGMTLLVLRDEGSGQRAYRLGERPGRRLGWAALAWLLTMLVAGGALRVAVGPGRTPLRLGWARVRTGAGAALPLTGWARMPDAQLAPARPGEAEERARQLQLGSRHVASQLLRGEVDPRWARAAAQLGATPTRFLWPVARGWFVRGYGSGTGGYHLAVDVAGEEGSTVRAAADGIVGYAGHEVRGFGNLLMLVHGGGFVTMYAHNQTHGVQAGEFVRAGAPIATLGSTGISRGPHVHFELIRDGRNCDPVPLFEPGVRHRESGFDTSRNTEWRDGRPRSVHCERRKRHPHSRWVVDEPLEPEAGAAPEQADALPEAEAQVDPRPRAAAAAPRPTKRREPRADTLESAQPASEPSRPQAPPPSRDHEPARGPSEPTAAAAAAEPKAAKTRGTAAGSPAVEAAPPDNPPSAPPAAVPAAPPAEPPSAAPAAPPAAAGEPSVPEVQ